MSLRIVYSTVHACGDQRKHQSSASLAFVRGIHRWPVNSPHKGPVTRKMFHLMTSSCTVHNQAPYHNLSGNTLMPIERVVVMDRKLDFYTARSRYSTIQYNTIMRSRYIALIFLWKTHERHPITCGKFEVWSVVRECKVWPKSCHYNCWVVCTIVLYVTAIYRESIVYSFIKDLLFRKHGSGTLFGATVQLVNNYWVHTLTCLTSVG